MTPGQRSAESDGILNRLADDVHAVVVAVHAALPPDGPVPHSVPFLYYATRTLDSSQERLIALHALLMAGDLSLAQITARAVLETAATVHWLCEPDDTDESAARLNDFIADDLTHEKRQLKKVTEAGKAVVAGRLAAVEKALAGLPSAGGVVGAESRIDCMLSAAEPTGIGALLYGQLSRNAHGAYIDLVTRDRHEDPAHEPFTAALLVSTALAAHRMAARLVEKRLGLSTDALDAVALSGVATEALEYLAFGGVSLR